MTTLTSALNYGALITLSCCNAVLQIAAAPACGDSAQDSSWLACAPGGAQGESELRRKLDPVEADERCKPVDSIERRPH